MKASEIITDVRRELLETSGVFWSDAELLRHLNRGELDFINRTRVLEDQAFLTTSPGVARYPLPDNWLSAKLVLFNSNEKAADDDSWHRLVPSNLEKMGQERPNFLNTTENHRGTPQRYFIWAKDIYLYPSPDNSTAGDLYLFYKAKPVALTSTDQPINLDDTLSEALNAYILWKAWTKSKERVLAEEQKNIYISYIGEGRRWAKRRSGDQRYKLDIISGQAFNESNAFDPLQ